MKEFDELLDVAQRLNGPEGCPWDRKQTFFSLQPYVLEEAHELIEAVDGQKNEEIIEELGDLLYTVIFYAKLAEKEDRFSMIDILSYEKEKLIRRHPHVFGALSLETEEDVMKKWEEIKREEKGKKERKTALDGIPDQLPLLAKAQKMHKIFHKTGFVKRANASVETEEGLQEKFWDLIALAEKSGIDIESLVRREVFNKKEQYSIWVADSKNEN